MTRVKELLAFLQKRARETGNKIPYKDIYQVKAGHRSYIQRMKFYGMISVEGKNGSKYIIVKRWTK